ncbi:MAG: DNRLRE domain-containing protein [Cyclobacteriaceae bacterium]|nr:DNRLRE domain-containing protein [Cyclobacteriaceae bacterium]
MKQGSQIMIEATVSGEAAKVEFYHGSNKIGETSSSPYTVIWDNTTYGQHKLMAVATTAEGASAISEVLIVDVIPDGNVLPSVHISTPTHESVFTIGDIDFSAQAFDEYGSISKVDFYIGESLIGSSSIEPYTIMWAPDTAGFYTLTAIAFDNDGASTTSLPIDVEIIPVLPGITYEAENYTESQGVTMSSAISGYLGSGYVTVKYVENFLEWNNVTIDSAGTYRLTFRYNNTQSNSAECDIRINGNVVKKLMFTKTSDKWETISYDTHFEQGTYTLQFDYRVHNKALNLDVMVVSPFDNDLPQSSIVSPLDGDSINIGSVVSIKVAAMDKDGISKVEVYDGTVMLGEVTQAPYTFVFRDFPGGRHAFKAIAYDSLGSETESEPINAFGKWSAEVIVPVLEDAHVQGNSTSTNFGSAVGMTVKGNSQQTQKRESFLKFDVSGLAGRPGTVLVLPIVAEETITGGVLDLYHVVDNTWVESQLTWNNKPAKGAIVQSYSIIQSDKGADIYIDVSKYVNEAILGDGIVSFALAQANHINKQVVIASKESTSESKPRLESMQVISPISVEITSPENNSSFFEPGNINLKATASHKDEKAIAKVEYYLGDVLIGDGGSEAPYQFNWQGVPVGSYIVTALATDETGDAFSSAPVKVSVLSTTAPTIIMAETTAEVSAEKPDETDGNPADMLIQKTANGSTDFESYIIFNISGLSASNLKDVFIEAYGAQHNSINPAVNPYLIDLYSCDSTNWSRTDLTWNIADKFGEGLKLSSNNVSSSGTQSWSSAELKAFVMRAIENGEEKIAFRFQAMMLRPGMFGWADRGKHPN